MPSGARKRKAAKKKQQKVTPTTPLSANTSSTTSSTQGDEDLKHHEIDGGHNTEGEEGIEKTTKEARNGDAAMVEKAEGQDEGGVQVEGRLKTGDGYDDKKGDSSSSGSNSDSDDGSREVEKNIMIVENAPVIDLVAADVPIADEPIEVTHTTPVTKLDNPVAECVSEAGERNILVQDEKVTVDSVASADSSVTHDVVELGQKDIGEAKLSLLEESARLPEVSEEPTPEDKDEENSRLPEVAKDLATEERNYEYSNVVATPNVTESAVNQTEEKLMLSYNPPKVDTTNDAERSQVSLTSAVRPDQTTSWKSCCGLFEAFTGTTR